MIQYVVDMWKWAWYEKDPAKKWARTAMFAANATSFLMLIVFVALAIVGTMLGK